MAHVKKNQCRTSVAGNRKKAAFMYEGPIKSKKKRFLIQRMADMKAVNMNSDYKLERTL